MYNSINYYSVTNNSAIIQITDNLRHILLVHDDDDNLFFLVLFCFVAYLCVYAELVSYYYYV